MQSCLIPWTPQKKERSRRSRNRCSPFHADWLGGQPGISWGWFQTEKRRLWSQKVCLRSYQSQLSFVPQAKRSQTTERASIQLLTGSFQRPNLHPLWRRSAGLSGRNCFLFLRTTVFQLVLFWHPDHLLSWSYSLQGHYCCYSHWTYLPRTAPNCRQPLKPPRCAIASVFSWLSSALRWCSTSPLDSEHLSLASQHCF